MSLFDVILLIIIAGFGMFGLWFGLIHTLGSLLGTALGAYLASRWYDDMAAWIHSITGWEGNWVNVLMFAIACIFINRMVGFSFWVVDRWFAPLTRLPFLQSLDRFLGTILGVFEGAVTCGLIFYFIDKFPVGDQFMGWVQTSMIVPYLVDTAAILLPLIPEAITQLESAAQAVVDQVIP